MSTAIRLAEQGLLPDAVVRVGIRRIIRRRLEEQDALSTERRELWLRDLSEGPIAERAEAANEQHYEVPADFFGAVLGPRRKYSCCSWPAGVTSLAAAEDASLEQVAARASLSDGQAVLDLGCGWGSFSLWAAERYPGSRFLAVSNSGPQRVFIEEQASRHGLGNLEVVTADANAFEPGRRFDRIVSIEMMEHARNWDELLRRMAGWLEADGRAFVHVFCHRLHAYPFEAEADDDWMARTFFTGGHMPSFDLPARFAHRLRVERRWAVSGRDYQRTAEAWLANLDGRRAEARRALSELHGDEEADLWLQRWRLFFLACSELFGWSGGDEWHVGHYRLARP